MTEQVQVPDGFKLHTENTSNILLSANEAFLNPVQEFNRDLSVACIRVWSEETNRVKEERWRRSQERKANRRQKKKDSTPADETTTPQTDAHEPVAFQPQPITILEALSATGLRSIRYAKEIPLVQTVIANDLDPAAVEAIRRNVAVNDLDYINSLGEKASRVKINEGDACALMFNHRQEKARVDVVDLDPYGTAAPFIDTAVQAVKDEGLLCVTCTDLAVLATTNFPEKCYSNYGGVPVKAEYCHESALRLVLHTISTSASRYGRFVEPLLSLSIDFYVRIWVRIKTSPIEVKRALTKNATYYICTSCQAHYEQPLGKLIENKHEASGTVNYVLKTHSNTVPERCRECESSLHVAGPMWSGPLHDPHFVEKVLEHVNNNASSYGTAGRMKGMLTIAKQELATPFYFTPSKVASFFHTTTPSLDDVASALLNAGNRVSRSHACPGSLKTDAPLREVHDIIRTWIKDHPVRMEKIGEKSPARRLLSKEPLKLADFTPHPDSVSAADQVKLVRYQDNPANWGPRKKATGHVDLKRKRSADDVGAEQPAAKQRETDDAP